MARVAGVEIPNNKHSEIALTYIFGIGRSSARAISPKRHRFNKKINDLSEEELDQIRRIIDGEYSDRRCAAFGASA